MRLLRVTVSHISFGLGLLGLGCANGGDGLDPSARIGAQSSADADSDKEEDPRDKYSGSVSNIELINGLEPESSAADGAEPDDSAGDSDDDANFAEPDVAGGSTAGSGGEAGSGGVEGEPDAASAGDSGSVGGVGGDSGLEPEEPGPEPSTDGGGGSGGVGRGGASGMDSGGAAGEPDVLEPEMTEPEMTEPEMTEPEMTEPEVVEPEVVVVDWDTCVPGDAETLCPESTCASSAHCSGLDSYNSNLCIEWCEGFVRCADQHTGCATQQQPVCIGTWNDAPEDRGACWDYFISLNGYVEAPGFLAANALVECACGG